MNHQNWRTGDVILEQYEVKDKLGEGGMGSVYRVHHRGWDLDLAVKRPQPAIFARVGGKENFIREAETWVNLALHPHIVSCYYVRTMDELPVIFAEYVPGGNLADWIRSRRLYEEGPQQALERMLDIAIQFAWGLHAAHEQGLVHQDIKPANVMMTPEGMPKVTDFGLARARAMAGDPDRGQQSILVSWQGMTPAYCSPEQAAQQALSHKTDIWSWAASILHMFAGGVTWLAGPAAGEALAEYLRRDPVEPHLPAVPAKLVVLLRHCFQLRPGDRPATMQEVVEALQEIYAHQIGQTYAREMPQPATMLADTLNNRALSLYDLNKVQEAIQVWEQALHVNPHHLETTYNRGVVLWRQGAITDDMLLHQLEMAKAAHTSPGRASYLLAQVHLEQGMPGKALPLLKKASNMVASEEEAQKLYQQAQAAAHDHRLKPSIFQVPGGFFQVADGFIEGCVSLSADGRFLAASSSGYKTALFWEVSTRRHRQFAQNRHTGAVTSVSLSADGSLLASSSSDRTVRLWETSTGHCRRLFRGHTGSAISVSLSTDARWLASGGHDSNVYVWDVNVHERHWPYRTFQGHTEAVMSVSLGADGSLLASGSHDSTIRLWDVSTGRCLHVLACLVSSVSLSADGSLLASGSHDSTIRLWETSTGRCVRIFQGHTESVISVSLSADGHWIASGSHDKTVRLWETSTGRCVRTFQNCPTSTVSLSADGQWLASESNEGKISLWKCHNSGFRYALSPSRIHSHAAVMRTEQYAMGQIKQAEQAYRENHVADALGLLHQLRTVPGWEHHPQSLEAWKTLSRVCARVTLRTGWPASVFDQSLGIIGLSADGNLLASGDEDRMVRLWETSTSRCVQTFQGHTATVSSVSLSADGSLLASGSRDSTLRLWETSTGRCLHIIQDHIGVEDSVSLSADGRWLASVSSGMLRLWKTSTGRCVRTFYGLLRSVSVSLSADGSLLASTLDDKDKVRLWETHTSRCVQTFQGHTDAVRLVRLSADGRWLVYICGDRTIYVRETSTGRCVQTFQGHIAPVTSVSLSTDGRWLASGSRDSTLRLWEVSTGHCLHIFQGHTDWIRSVSLSADGCFLASGSSDHSARLWALDWSLEACELADWDERVRPYLEVFLAQHTPHTGRLPRACQPATWKIPRILMRQSLPAWNEEDFQGLIRQLQDAGYGWLRPEGVREQLEQMVREW
ncbi:hypothetical protein KSD_59200 [Ktedonobacter sp. SOSP1-85]|uniref:protein kinase domain-containing protein n=1 Tax=Ktedonobacter sp. SOSP1-85 TaxID=2778367 RepID=UPI00191592E7|nr:protein kinase [Ktedonobacter sp. SOSP1-85]GHO78149.1 hypothetical protein KSD_59200 [Ktedonobacter sp. SOSP1-85]